MHGSPLDWNHGKIREGPNKVKGIEDVSPLPVWAQKFRQKNLPCVGDDIKAQIGATIIHRTLARLFEDRGVKLEATYQLNTGGNTDFLNMLDRSRLSSKKTSQTEAVQSQLAERLDDDHIHIGPSDYVAWQNDNKVCFLRMEGRGFASVPLEIELRLSVEDSPNRRASSLTRSACARWLSTRVSAARCFRPAPTT